MQTALAAASDPLTTVGDPEQQVESDTDATAEPEPSDQNQVKVPTVVTEQPLETVASEAEAQPQPVPTTAAELVPPEAAESPIKEQEGAPPMPESGAGGPVDAEEDVTEATLPLPPRLQGLMRLRRESLGILPPTQGPAGQGLPPTGPAKPFTPAAHRAFTPRGKENFTPIIGLSSVRKFRTPALDRAAPGAVPLPVRPARNEDTTAELEGEDDGTGRIPGRISFAEFLYKAEVSVQ